MREALPTMGVWLALVALAGPVTAAPRAVSRPSVPAPTNALERLASMVALRVVPVRAGGTSVCVRGPERLAATLGARLRAELNARPCPATGEKWERLIDVQLTVVDDRVRASGEVRDAGSALWGVTETRLVGTVFAESPLDDELRAMLAPGVQPLISTPVTAPSTMAATNSPAPAPSNGPLRQRTLPVPDLDALALAFADVDGDGRSELVVLTPSELVVLRVDPTVVELRRLALPAAPSPSLSRVETASLAVRGNEIFAHPSNLRDGLHWRPKSATAPELVERWRGHAFSGVDKCETVPGTDLFQCAGVTERVWTALATSVAGGRVVASGPASVSGLTGLGGPELLAGTAMTAGHLPRGDVVAYSDARVRGEPDAVTVRLLSSGLPVVGRLEHLGGVRALGIGVVAGSPVLAALVRDAAAKKSELWLID